MAICVTAVVMLCATSALAAARSGHSGAIAAHALNGNDNAELHLLRASGSDLIEEGHASGGLPGTIHATLNVGATFTGTFTFYTRYGQIRGRGSATPHQAGHGVESFAGTMTAIGGTGRYAHVHGRANLYGTFNRTNYKVIVQTRGILYD